MTTKTGVGGRSDLTTMFPNAEDAEDFHVALKYVCDLDNPNHYRRCKKRCDAYFQLPHRSEPRGAGGVFCVRRDSGDWKTDYSFTCETCLYERDRPRIPEHLSPDRT